MSRLLETRYDLLQQIAYTTVALYSERDPVRLVNEVQAMCLHAASFLAQLEA